MTLLASARASFVRECAHLARNPWDLAVLTWLPLLLCALIAGQISGGVVRALPIVLVDQDRTALGRDLAVRLEATPGLSLVARAPDLATAERLVRARQAHAVLMLPPNTAARILNGQAPVILYFNASYPSAAAVIQREVSAVIEAANRRLALERLAAIGSPSRVRPAPVRVVTAIAWNAPASQELQLVSLLHPALLHLLFMLALVSAFGRELRDSTVAQWAPDIGALLGKASVYVAVFLGWAALVTLWLAGVRGWSIQGAPWLLAAGYIALYLAYAGVALLLVGLTRTLSQALSLTGIYAGASFAFAGGVFPLDQASGFGRLWGTSLPFTNFARVVARTWIADAPLLAAAQPLLPMLIMALGTGLVGASLYLGAARDPAAWGRR